MLRSTFYTFTTALRGMNSAQKGLDVTGQNISNAKTPGYTRQRADIYAAVAGGYGDRYATRMSTMAGQGSIVDSISQIRDQFLDVRFRRETAAGSEDATKLDVMNDMERFFNEIEKSGLQDSFNNFVTRLQQLSRNVESPEFDNLARDAAQSLAMQLNHYARQLKSVREGQEYNLKKVDVPEVNDLLKKIGELNRSIREVQANGGPALELKDERNLLLDKLASHVDITVNYKPNYMAGDLMVEDVTISLIGKSKVDGSRIEKPIVYNESVAKLKVETPSADGTRKSYVTVDATDLPAKDLNTKLEGFLRAMANANANVMQIKNKVNGEYDKYQEFFKQVTPPPPATPLVNRPALTAELDPSVQDIINTIFDKTNATQFPTPIAGMTKEEFTELIGIKTADKIEEALKNTGGVIEKLKEVVQKHKEASKKYNELVDK
ncbi:MAG: flagellar hook-associated protein FlgK, partial [Eubacteriales bacterium]